MMPEERSKEFMDYFEHSNNVARLREELKRWVGTSFRYSTQGRAQPRVTADCVSFPIGVFKNLNLIPGEYQTPPYCSRPTDTHQLDQILVDMDHKLNLRLVWEPGQTWIPLSGDILVCSFKRGIQHLLIADGEGLAWDCWPQAGVRTVPLHSDRIQHNVQRIYRWRDHE